MSLELRKQFKASVTNRFRSGSPRPVIWWEVAHASLSKHTSCASNILTLNPINRQARARWAGRTSRNL